ncbi:MAG: hypothetical protein GX442_22735 [Candidatus Riflebacteria bacterium]|nr:hypothetical protein [Candidatus Riflebacteria bacterium]
MEFTAEALLLSVLITWGIGLAPPIVIRYLLWRKPLSKTASITLCVLFWVTNLGIFLALGSTSKSHGVLYLIAFVSHGIYTSGGEGKA